MTALRAPSPASSHPSPARAVPPPLALAFHRKAASSTLPPTRQLLRATAASYRLHGHRYHADLRLVAMDDASWVVKDMAHCAPWFRLTLGRWLLQRELKALMALQGLPGFPEYVARIDGDALAYRHVQGVALDHLPPLQLSTAFFQRLEEALERMHGRGIVHLNLGRGKDIVVTPDQRPVIVDFQHHIQLPRWMKHLVALVAHFDFRAMSAAWRRYTLAVLQSEEASLKR